MARPRTTAGNSRMRCTAVRSPLPTAPPPPHFIGTDGAPSGWVVDNDKNGIIEPANGDKVTLFIGMRRGGQDIYAFDVTPTSPLSDPSATVGITPKFLWRIKGGAGGDFAGLGQTWSYPR